MRFFPVCQVLFSKTTAAVLLCLLYQIADPDAFLNEDIADDYFQNIRRLDNGIDAQDRQAGKVAQDQRRGQRHAPGKDAVK